MALDGGPGGTHINMTACQDEVSYIGQAQVAEDIEHLRNALAKAGAEDHEAFIPAAPPGCITNAAENFHYPSYEAYLDAVTAAMSVEYRAIVGAGFIFQLDCPDLPMAAHTSFWAVKHMEEMGRQSVCGLVRGRQPASRARVGDARRPALAEGAAEASRRLWSRGAVTA